MIEKKSENKNMDDYMDDEDLSDDNFDEFEDNEEV